MSSQLDTSMEAIKDLILDFCFGQQHARDFRVLLSGIRTELKKFKQTLQPEDNGK